MTYILNDKGTPNEPSPSEVAKAFLTPRRPRSPAPLVVDGGEDRRIFTSEGEIALRRAGTGPTVLLLHGWEGQSSDLADFVPALLAAGFSILAMDLPAHGASSGQLSSIPQAARALGTVGEELGPLYAAVAHSLGAPVLVEALFAGLKVQRVVLVSTPVQYERHARGFAAAAGLNAEGTEAMLQALNAEMGAEIRDVSLLLRAPHMRTPALFIHSSDDRVADIQGSVAAAAVWPGARHIKVDGLGHRRILNDPSVVTAAMGFLVETLHWV